MFDYLYPLVAKKMGEKIGEIVHKQNSTGNSPLRIFFLIIDYAVITDSKDMVVKLLSVGADPNI